MGRILLVDDQVESLRPLEKLLRLDGFRPVSTDEPERAIELLRTERFVAVVTDLEMPMLDGITVLEVAYATQEDAVLILATANTRFDGDAPRGTRVIHKPLDYDALLALLPEPPAREVVREHAIHSALAPLTTLAASFLEGMVVVDREHRVIVANEAAARILGPKGGAPRGLAELVAAALEGKEVAPARHVFARDDERRFVRASAAPVRDAAGEVVGAIVLLCDMGSIVRC